MLDEVTETRRSCPSQSSLVPDRSMDQPLVAQGDGQRARGTIFGAAAAVVVATLALIELAFWDRDQRDRYRGAIDGFPSSIFSNPEQQEARR